MRTTHVVCFAVVALVLAMGAGGCTASRPSSLKAWQGAVQDWVNDRGNGDINALRETEVARGRPGLRVASQDRPENSRDFAGVLVGTHSAAGAPWYLYVIGEMDKDRLVTTRLAAVAQRNGKLEWRMGDADASATAAYLQHREQAWRDRHPDLQAPPAGALTFPQPEDQFTLQASGDTVSVRETASGA